MCHKAQIFLGIVLNKSVRLLTVKSSAFLLCNALKTDLNFIKCIFFSLLHLYTSTLFVYTYILFYIVGHVLNHNGSVISNTTENK